jgi:predicted transcriptional regulator
MTDTDTSTGPETEETIIAEFSGCLPLAPLDEALMMTTGIVVAYVSNNHIGMSDLPSLIRLTYNALKTVGEGVNYQPAAAAAPLVPAVPVKKSITPDYIVCLEDGRQMKSLKRHLRSKYDLTPEQYRARWDLPADYPMVAPNYAAARSALAKGMGLGHQRRKTSAPEPMQAAA